MNTNSGYNSTTGQWGEETARFEDTTAASTQATRIFSLIVLGVFNLGVIIGSIGIALATETSSRWLICGAGLFGIFVIDLFVYMAVKGGGQKTVLVLYQRGIAIENVMGFSDSELMSIHAMSAPEVKRFEQVHGDGSDSLVIPGTNQYYLGIDFKRGGVQNCYIAVFQNRHAFDDALQACNEHLATRQGVPEINRVWTANSGHRFEGAFMKAANNMVLIKAPSGQFMKIPAESLSPPDRAWISQHGY